MAERPAAINQVYNIGSVERGDDLKELFAGSRNFWRTMDIHWHERNPDCEGSSDGDVRHSLADVGKASQLLGSIPRSRSGRVGRGEAWYRSHVSAQRTRRPARGEIGSPPPAGA